MNVLAIGVADIAGAGELRIDHAESFDSQDAGVDHGTNGACDLFDAA